MNDIIEQKITNYSAADMRDDPNEPTSIRVGDAIKLNFEHGTDIDMRNHKLENEIMDKYQQVDISLNQCERIVGIWKPENKFSQVYV